MFWGNTYFYAFPPFCLIARCLQKVMTDKANGLLIVPFWPTQPWFAKLLHMLVAPPILLPQTRSLLTKPVSRESHPMSNKMFLLCCRLSGTPSLTKDYRDTLSISFSTHGGVRPTSSTEVLSHGGWTTVCHGRKICYIRI